MAVMAMFVTTVKAQTSLLATLNHQGKISTFYGNKALQQAHAAAVDGDVINLSSGTFQAENVALEPKYLPAILQCIKVKSVA